MPDPMESALYDGEGRGANPMPVIGFLSSRSPDESGAHVTAFRLGMKEVGDYVEGENVHIAFRWAEGQNNRLPALAADLVERRVGVIVAAGGGPSINAAKAATPTIPIVFTFSGDPVKAGFVASLNKPGANITGVSWFGSNLAAKKLELLLQLVPDATIVALLLNPNNAEVALQPLDFEQAARKLDRQFHILNAGSENGNRPLIRSTRRAARRRAGPGLRSVLLQPTTADRRAGRAARDSDDLSGPRVCGGGRLDELRKQHRGRLSPSR